MSHPLAGLIFEAPLPKLPGPSPPANRTDSVNAHPRLHACPSLPRLAGGPRGTRHAGVCAVPWRLTQPPPCDIKLLVPDIPRLPTPGQESVE